MIRVYLVEWFGSGTVSRVVVRSREVYSSRIMRLSAFERHLLLNTTLGLGRGVIRL